MLKGMAELQSVPGPHGFKLTAIDRMMHCLLTSAPLSHMYGSLLLHAISSQNPHASTAVQMEQMAPLRDHKNTNMTECLIQSCRYRKLGGGGLQSRDSFLLLIHSLLSAFFISRVRCLCTAGKVLCCLPPDRREH